MTMDETKVGEHADHYLGWYADAGQYVGDDPWLLRLRDAWRAGFTSVELDDEIDYDAELYETEVAIYWAAWRLDHVSEPTDGELRIAYDQGVRAVLKALGAKGGLP